MKKEKQTIFEKVLDRFTYTVIDGDIKPVLTKGTLAELYTFIKSELEDEKEDPVDTYGMDYPEQEYE